MKKFIGIVVVVLVLAFAGSALAYGGRGHCGGQRMGGGRGNQAGGTIGNQGPRMHGQGMRGNRGGASSCFVGTGVEMPQDIRDKLTEAQKTAIDMWAEMDRTPVDRAKVEALRTKHRELRNAVSDWCFSQRLETNR